MSIFPSTIGFDGFFIDVVLMRFFPFTPFYWEQNGIRKCFITGKFQEILSCLAFWISREIGADLSLNMYKTSLHNALWIYFPESSKYTNSPIRCTRLYIRISHVISEKLEIFYKIYFPLSISYTKPDYFFMMIIIVENKYFRFIQSCIWILHLRKPIPIDHNVVNMREYFINTGDLRGV